MKLKKAILSLMDRDTLNAVVDDLELDGVDRRNCEDMAAAIEVCDRMSAAARPSRSRK